MGRRFSYSRNRPLTRYEATAERFASSRAGYRYLLHVAPKLDRLLIPASKGRLSSVGKDLVGMVTTTGAKSGRPRPQPLVCIPEADGTLLLVGSNYGRPHHPGWVYNLRAHPTCTVTFRGSTREFTATELEGSGRDDAWSHAVDWIRGYALYEQTAHPRRIALFRLAQR